jgi:hypoxanthine-guanine phosphoribosyltransferase
MRDYIEAEPHLAGTLEYIISASNMSPWLNLSMSALSGDLEADQKEIFSRYKGAYSYEKLFSNVFDDYKDGTIILVVDFINSGETIKSQIVKIFDRFKEKGFTKSKLRLVSILNNEKERIELGKREVSIINEKFEVSYFLDVSQSERAQDDCDHCRFGYDHDNFEEEKFLKFRSYDFWKLADEYDFEEEKFKPEYAGRERIKKVPIFLNWLRIYAPYLAFKFKKYIEFLDINKQLNFALVYPDESKRIIEEENGPKESASMVLAKKINEIFGISIIGIPRTVVDDVKGKRIKMHDITDSNEYWKKTITSIPPNTDLIIIDEFLKDGGSLDSMISILEWLNKPAKCFFAIADLNSKNRKHMRNVKEGFEILSLYDLNYN